MKILSKYITRQAVITLFFTISVFTFVLLLARILKQLSDMLVNQKVGLDVVGYFVLLVTPNILGFSLPMAMLATRANGAVRSPEASSWNRSPSRSAICSTDSARIRSGR